MFVSECNKIGHIYLLIIGCEGKTKERKGMVRCEREICEEKREGRVQERVREGKEGGNRKGRVRYGRGEGRKNKGGIREKEEYQRCLEERSRRDKKKND